MTTTAKLGMTLWEAGSGNPSPAHNDALTRLDFFASNTVISRSTDAQPGSPTNGDAYIITGSATGADWGASPFAEFDIAVYETQDGITGWYRYDPVEGFPILVQDEGKIVYWDGAAYSEVTAAAANPTEAIGIAVSDETTALTTGTAKVTFRMPYAFTLTGVRASVTTAPTGAAIAVDINEGGVSVLSTVITIDATEKTSTTAATPPVISDSSLADDAEMTIDIDAVGSTIAGAGLKVWLIGTRT